MAQVFQQTFQNINILIQDKLGHFVLTNPIPYKSVDFPHEALNYYLRKNNIRLVNEQDVKVLKYKHVVSRPKSSLELLVTFWVKSINSEVEIRNALKDDIAPQDQQTNQRIVHYKKLIQQKIYADTNIFALQGSEVQFIKSN